MIAILRQQGFSLSDIERALGSAFPAADPAADPTDAASRCNIRITRPESGASRFDSDLVQLFLLPGFMTVEECGWLVAWGRPALRPSTITIPSPDPAFRTSTTSDLAAMEQPFVDWIDSRIADVIGLPRHLGESIQAQRYEPGQQFKDHTDYFEPNTAEFDEYGGSRGNRTWTFMVYLSAVERGGGTHFPSLGHTFYPQVGTAVIWNNLHADGTPNAHTMHCGQPVEVGEKIIITKWFRELAE
jgi:prolyl 4-hydroxylase